MRWLHFWRSHKTFSSSLTPRRTPHILPPPPLEQSSGFVELRNPRVLFSVIQLASVSKKLRCIRKFKWLDQRLLADLTPERAQIYTERSEAIFCYSIWDKRFENKGLLCSWIESFSGIWSDYKSPSNSFFQCTRSTQIHSNILLHPFLCRHFPFLVAS